MISITELALQYGGRLLFDEVSFNLLSPNRYGLVGANGTGKSTFLRLLASEEQPSLGNITVSSRATIGWLKQDQFKYEQNTVIETVLQGKGALWAALKEKEKILQSGEFDEKTGYRLASLEEIIMHQQGYTADNFIASLLVGLGIEPEYHHKRLSELSGGFKLRVLLAQTLFSEPDILLLDEPTNHLDIMSIAWLEDYLKKNFKGLLVFISHDYDFLNHLSTHILDIDYGEIKEYVGNYEKFLQEKKMIVEQKMHEMKYLEKKIEHMKYVIEKFRAGTRAKQSQSREKMLEKIELPDIKKSSRVKPNFYFKQRRPSGKTVLTVSNLSKQFKDKPVFKNISFSVKKGEKIAIIGHNGIGKSTMLKVLLGQHTPDNGEYTWGHETHISYFAQDHHEQLKGNFDLIQWLSDNSPQSSTENIRKALGACLFPKDDVYKIISVLSGGEAARLLFANIMLSQNNVLILDEPTNHLDIDAKEALAEALVNYDGTLLLVSHDRHFVSNIATRVLAFTEKRIVDHEGPYSEYLSRYGEDFLNREWMLDKA